MKRQKSKPYLWDYDYDELKKTEEGRIKILERMINYGPGKEKIKLSLVKKYWPKLDLYEPQRYLLSILLGKKWPFLTQSKNKFSIK